MTKDEIKLSPMLREFLEWWETEAAKDVPNWTVSQVGLCFSFTEYLEAANLPYDECDACCVELRALLQATTGDETCPFNDNGVDYSYESSRRKCHLNPKRRQWVRARLDEHEKGTRP